MAERDFSEQLNTVVDAILQEHELPTFTDSWELSLKVLGSLPVRRFYASADEGYANVGILTDTLVLDIEGDDESEDSVAGVSVRRLAAISGVELIEAPVEDVPDSEDAQLVLLAYVAGSEVVDLHWIAYTDEEEDYLSLFGEALVQAIAQF